MFVPLVSLKDSDWLAPPRQFARLHFQVNRSPTSNRSLRLSLLCSELLSKIYTWSLLLTFWQLDVLHKGRHFSIRMIRELCYRWCFTFKVTVSLKYDTLTYIQVWTTAYWAVWIIKKYKNTRMKRRQEKNWQLHMRQFWQDFQFALVEQDKIYIYLYTKEQWK